ncbi:MAG: GHKL domain-containing protein [Spirochaetales bacterium]|nr:GHKL domain-containing protein [Spirochaetales bacterium]
MSHSRVNYKTLFDSAGDPMLLLEKEHLLDCNKMTLHILQCKKQDLINKPMWDISPEFQSDGENSKEKVQQIIRKALNGEPQLFEWKFKAFHNTTIDVQVSLNCFDKAHGLCVAIWRIVPKKTMPEDWKNEKKLRERILLRTQRLASLGELISALAHEIRQPLHGMKLIIEGIIYWENQKQKVDEKSQKNLEYLAKVIDGIDRIDNVIDTVYKSIQHKDKIVIEPVNFNTVILNVLDIFKHKLKYHGIEIRHNLDPYIETVSFTIIQAEQVVINLLSNAIKALDKTDKKNKHISILTQEMKDYLLLEISDNGTGIKDEVMEDIFNPLFTTEKDTESFGMGLYVVHTILESFHAAIDVVNNPHEGVTFRIKFIRG